MNNIPWKPWHEVVKLRDDLKSGELSLSIFAADLYDVVMGKAKPVYQTPSEFFALTYPTFNLRELVKDIILRLSGKSDKAVRQLELTYGGGKTHTLITLYHLVFDPDNLPDLPSVKEFIEHAGIKPPKARVAVLAFDKLDVEKGMEISDPQGNKQWLKHPWSVLAWQIAGAEGLKLLHAEGEDKERESAPADNLLESLLSIPAKEGLAVLVLIDEVLMYAREKIGMDPVWKGRLQNFFQSLTQAATKVDRCAVVASLLATDPSKSDQTGKEIIKDLYGIFRREREEGVQPVVKEDVAEVLRRRFFTLDSIKDREAFRVHIVAALKGISALDDETKKAGNTAEERFLKSYPFHPDLTEVFYTKWTGLEGFQRTRGVLRTFALALREAEKWDQSPIVSENVFLTKPDAGDISEALRELTTIASTEEYEGKRQEWSGIIQGELNKARDIQKDYPGLKHREIERAVIATFMHSQPIGHKAATRELFVLLGQTRPDKIELEKAMIGWSKTSWFLDESAMSADEILLGGKPSLPKFWRLGSRPNLKQMHNDALTRVPQELVEFKLVDAIRNLKSLTSGASALGARVHNLPQKPSDIQDDGDFHYAVLGPLAASMSGKPSAEARAYIEETTGSDKPRVYRNAVVLAVPSRDGLELARDKIREYLAWEDVREALIGKKGENRELDPIRHALLSGFIDDARYRIPEAIKQAYCIVVTVSDKNEVQAFKITPGDNGLFVTIKDDSRSRIQETVISADALLPGGPYDLWKEGDTARRVKDLVGAFAQLPQLPKMLRRKEILDTLVLGAKEGFFVLRTMRPDRSIRTIWRQEPSEADLKDPGLEVVLPKNAELTELSHELLVPSALPGLWDEKSEITVREVLAYFSGGKVVKIKKETYEEPIEIPKVERSVVENAISVAVESGKLWLASGAASIFAEPIPAGLLMDTAGLMPPPTAIPATDVLPANLPDAWRGEITTAVAISAALSQKAGRNLPWATVRAAIDGAIRARMLERAEDSGPWPCEFASASTVKLRIPQTITAPIPPPPPSTPPGVRVCEAELKPNEIQDLADVIGDIVSAAVGYDLKFQIKIQLGGAEPPSGETVIKVNEILKGVSDKIQLH